MHTAHPDVHDHGLADDCPRCAEQAEKPIRELDEKMLSELAALAVHRDRLMRGRSEAELVAAANVLNVLEQVGRLCDVAPAVVESYLRERWRIDVQIRAGG